jgi:organic hydroperoxide reductase OsmC/OhrA
MDMLYTAVATANGWDGRAVQVCPCSRATRGGSPVELVVE